MAQRLTDKTVLVTGAATGIGAATAKLCAQEGARVLLCGQDPEALNRNADAIGDQALAQPLDIADEDAWGAAVATAKDRFGGLDVLVNVAGIFTMNGLEETDLDEWNKIVAVNQTGTWLGMKASMPLLRASGNGSIVNTCSMLGVVGSGRSTAYQGTKGAIRLITKTAAVEYASQGVRVNCVHPGVIATPMIQEILDEQGDQQPDIQRTPMKRAGEAVEVATAVVFLASDEASYITGAELPVDGGCTAY